jgi:hypothetical protein
VDSTVPPEAIVGGDAPNNTLHLKIPSGPATFAQVNTAAPIARAEGDMWFDTSRPPTVPALLVSSKEFTDGIQVYNTTQNAIVASINSDGTASFVDEAATLTLGTNWENYTPAGYGPSEARRDASGMIHLHGLVKTKSGLPITTNQNTTAYRIGIIPSGYRPVYNHVLAGWWTATAGGAAAEANNGPCRVNIYPSGEVTVSYGFVGGTWLTAGTANVNVGYLTLTGISYKGAP